MPRRKIFRVLLVVLVLALVPVGVFLVRTWRAERRLADLLAELDRAEPGWRIADIEARKPVIADAKNSAVVIKLARLPASRKDDFQLEDFKLEPYRTLTPLQAARLREYLDRYRDNLLEARRLVEFPTGQFPVRIAPDFISTLLPHVQEVRELGYLLNLDMIWQAQQGAFEHIATDLEAARNASRPLRHEPFLISQLVRMAMLSQCTETLERVLAQGQPAPKDLKQMQDVLGQEPIVACWFEAMAGERAGMHEMFQRLDSKANMRMLRGMTGVGSQWHDDITDFFIPWSAQESHIWVLRNFTDQIATRDLPLPERRARLNELFAEAEKAPLVAKTLMAPNWRRVYDRFVEFEAKLAATRAGLAVERFRREKGRWPKTLEELVPDWLEKAPIDPFDEAPLRFRHAADGVVIYSVGPEGKLKGNGRDHPPGLPVPPEASVSNEFRLWNVDQRRRPGKDQ